MRYILAILSFVATCHCFGQKQGNIWYFGNHAGIDFNSGIPVALTNGAIYFNDGSHNEGSSAISDSAGNILFYSDGMNVWNRNHQLMENGTGLKGNYSSTHSSIIIPDPVFPQRYFYLLTLASGFCCPINGGGYFQDGLRYSKIDMCGDNGLGSIDSMKKNIKLVDSVSEKIAVTRHSNGVGYWVLTHRFYSNEFWALYLTPLGFIDTVVSAIGSEHTGTISSMQGQLKFSSDGKKIAIGSNNASALLEVFDFDKSTGVVSNFRPLNRANNGNIYGVEFSQDGSKLYATSWISQTYDLSQYDLSSDTISTINASRTTLSTNTGVKGLQIGPDSKIYMVGINNASLSVINNPNVKGLGCDYQGQSISLAGKSGSYSLPSFIAGYDYSNGLSECSFVSLSDAISDNAWQVHPNPFSNQIEFTCPHTELATVSVYNFVGQQVIQLAFTGSATINTEHLATGIYFYILHSRKGVSSGKIVKN